MDKSFDDKSSSSLDPCDSSDSEADLLKIVEKLRTPRKKSREIKFDGSEKLDKTIEETIAKCENFTPEAAKKMLLTLVKNEHILALSLLQAEDEISGKSGGKSSDSDDDDDKKSEIEAPSTPKLTRLKAKQLNKTLPTPGSLKTTEPCEDVVALIQEDLKSDDEDDEYQPCEDDAMSDEDITNTTISDIESQPSTPGSALLYREQEFDSPLKDGEFRVPRSKDLSQEEQENIARRTRSKLCLTTTAIQTIESTFIPPDITIDMYDFDQENEIDSEWKDFLNEFMMPLTNAEEDDEKSDPEYVASEAGPIDKEELRPVRVSKKELNQLISELLEDSCNFSFDQEPSTSSKRTFSEIQASKTKRQRTSSPSPRLKQQSQRASTRSNQNDELLNTPPHHQVEKKKENPEISFLNTPLKTGFVTPTQMQSPASYSYSPAYQPAQCGNPPIPYAYPTHFSQELPLLTPAPPTSNASLLVQGIPMMTPAPATPISASAQGIQLNSPLTPNFPQITGVYGSLPSSAVQSPATPQILVMNAHNQLEVRSPSNLLTQAFSTNGVIQLPQFQSVVIQVPTIDLLRNQLDVSTSGTATIQEMSQPVQIEESTAKSTKKSGSKDRREKLKLFEYLETEVPAPEPVYSENAVGFTNEQRQIYEQQMRIHTQLLSQHFMQFYGNPKWWEKAEPVKQQLSELHQVVKPENSPQTAKHIDRCIEMCSSWEKELDENSERNKKYAEFMYNEMEFDEENCKKKIEFKGRFHNRFMEHMLSSRAILYPNLLPLVPFRAVTINRVEAPNSELSLFGIGLERFYNELYQELNRLNPRTIRYPKLNRLATRIIKIYNSFREEKHVIKILENYKVDKRMNPIKYFFMHKRAPAVKHLIEDVDVDNVKPPKMLRRGLLPKTWDKYMFSYERLQIHPYQPDEEESEEIENSSVEADIQEIQEVEPILQQETNEIIPQHVNQTLSIDNQYKIEITYEQIPKINICFIPSLVQPEPQSEKIPCITISSPAKLKEKSTEEKQKNLTSILKKVSDCVEKSPVKKKSVNFLLPAPRKRSSERLGATRSITDTFALTQKFFIIIEEYFSEYIKTLHFRDTSDPLLIYVFNWTKTIDIYGKLMQKAVMSKKRLQDGAGTSEQPTKSKKNLSTGEEYSKKLHRKLLESRNLIMEGNRNKCTIEKDCSFAYNYLERVKKTMHENGDDELYSELMKVLSAFNPDFESVPELYHKMELLMSANYSDLLDLFLTFLLPEHAVEIGKFFEHFVLTKMKNLLQKLSLFFNKQPSHIKKIYMCLNDLSNDPDLTMERLKTRILPLLKGNQVLIDWFMELFEKPPETLSAEFESVYIKKSLSDSENSTDNFEEIHSKDIIEAPNVDEMNSCGVRYKNGRIMYHHGVMLPAKIAFLAHDAPASVNISESLCMHEIRNHVKFSDPKKTDAPSVTEPSKKHRKRPKLCDAQTLHAHAVRLNPIHARSGEKLSDLAHLLSPPPNLNGDEKNSPKKQKNIKKSPKKKSPQAPQPTSQTTTPTGSPSKVLQTAKKLKNLVDDQTEEPLKKKVKVDEPKPAILLKPVKKTPQMQPSTSKKPAEDPPKSDNESGWTRVEDKEILEEIKPGWMNWIHSKQTKQTGYRHIKTEELLSNLQKKLQRTRDEINERFEFLLDILATMKNVDLNLI